MARWLAINPTALIDDPKGRPRVKERPPTANFHSPIRVTRYYAGVLIPFLSISIAFPSRFNRVSSFLASVIQRQYSLRCV